jgi:hypothetical protein
MKFKFVLSCLLILTLTGCATYKGVGSQTWYDQRTTELEEARKTNKMTEAEYQTARNQVDQVRVNYLNHDYSYPRTSVGLGWWF